MTPTPNRLRTVRDEEDSETRHRRRSSDKLLTLDRALLAGIFAAGAWYATTDLRAGNVQERVAAMEKRQEQFAEQRGLAAVEHAAEIATIKQQLRDIDRRTESIEENLGKLADSTARLANAVPDRRSR